MPLSKKFDDNIMAKFEEIIAEYNVNECQEDQMLQFLCLVGRLKVLPRRGWIIENHNIQNSESIAGHMYRMGIMSMLFDNSDSYNDLQINDNTDVNRDDQEITPSKLNINKMIQMSLIHDIAECIVGDITPMDGITSEDKQKHEMDAFKNLISLLPLQVSKRLLSLYTEYESRQTPEAILVKEMDRFDLCLQAFQYEKQEYSLNHIIRFDSFFKMAKEHVKHPLLHKMVERLICERELFWNKNTANNV